MEHPDPSGTSEPPDGHHWQSTLSAVPAIKRKLTAGEERRDRTIPVAIILKKRPLENEVQTPNITISIKTDIGRTG